jgi:hypothetical protein
MSSRWQWRWADGKEKEVALCGSSRRRSGDGWLRDGQHLLPKVVAGSCVATCVSTASTEWWGGKEEVAAREEQRGKEEVESET